MEFKTLDNELPLKGRTGPLVRLAIIKAFMALAILFPAQTVQEPDMGPNSLATAPLNGSRFSQQPSRQKALFAPFILSAASRYRVDPALIKAVIMAESGYNPIAVSKKGARGLMQLMPRTAEALGVEEPFNPEQNINAGVRYLRQLMNQFEGDIALALAAYNAGSRKVKKYQGIPPYRATQQYVEKVFQYYRHYKKNGERRSSSI